MVTTPPSGAVLWRRMDGGKSGTTDGVPGAVASLIDETLTVPACIAYACSDPGAATLPRGLLSTVQVDLLFELALRCRGGRPGVARRARVADDTWVAHLRHLATGA